MNIHYEPLFDTQKICEHYSEKDGVPITYVCTSALGGEAQAMDIFFRETPHPEFGNRYFGLFGLYQNAMSDNLMITNADRIESVEFGMKEHEGEWHYSQHRHHFNTIGDVSLDGGRAYFRCVGNISKPTKFFVVRDGKMMEKIDA